MNTQTFAAVLSILCLLHGCAKGADHDATSAKDDSAVRGETRPDESLKPSCGGNFGLCGFVDVETKKVVVPLQYDRVLKFSEGVAGVQKNGVWRYIDTSGETALNTKFDAVGSFNDGLALVLKSRHIGLIDRSGAVVIKPNYKCIKPVSNDFFLITAGEARNDVIDGKQTLDNSYACSTRSIHKSGIYQLSKGWHMRPAYALKPFHPNPEKYVWASETTFAEHTLSYGLMTLDGEWVIQPTFDGVFSSPGSDQVTIMKRGTRGEGQLRGLMDKDGNILIEPRKGFRTWRGQFGIQYFGPSLQKATHFEFVGIDGTTLPGGPFDEYASDRVRKGDKWFSVDESGGLIPDVLEGKIKLECESGLTLKQESGRIAVYKPNGTRASEDLFDDHHYREIACEQEAIGVRKDELWRLVTHEGDILPPFEKLGWTQNGMASVKSDGYWGVIDLTGKFIIEPEYDKYIRNTSEDGFLKGERDGKDYAFDMSGKRLPTVPDQPSDEEQEKKKAVSSLLDCDNGAKRVKRRGKWGMVDENGKTLIKARHRALSCFENGMAWAPVSEKSEWCPIGADGKFRNGAACQTKLYPSTTNWSHFSRERLSEDAFESSVLWYSAYLDFANGDRADAPALIPHGFAGHEEKTTVYIDMALKIR